MIISKILEKFKIAVCNLFYAARSLLWKRDEGIVLLDAWFGVKFADNPRFLFQYLSAHKEELSLSHVVWVTRDKEINKMLNDMGYESYMIDSKESKYYHKHAAYHIVCNSANGGGKSHSEFSGEVLRGYSYRAKRINLWHGIAGKGVKFGSNEIKARLARHPLFAKFELFIYDRKWYRLFVENYCGWGDNYVLVQSTEHMKVAKAQWRLPDQNHIFTGYPRVCKCERYTPTEEKVISLMKKYKSVFLYLPTFRSNTKFNFDSVADKLKDILLKNDILWIQKMHSADVQSHITAEMSDNIISLDPNFDINVLYPYITFMVTDYSSCMLEAVYFGKGLIFYIPDFDNFINNDRGIMFDPNLCMAGPKCKTIDELRAAILKYKDDPNTAKSETYQQVYDLYWKETGAMQMGQIWNNIVRQTKKIS